MTTGRDIAVVGAGIFGAAAALQLARRGWRVTLLDRGVVPHAEASSTDVSKVVRMDYGSDVFYHELAEAALDGWDRWNAEWTRPLYHPDGFLVLSAGPMDEGFEYESYRVLQERGHDPRRLGPDDLRARHPMWSAERYPDGYLNRRGGWAESGAVVRSLVEQGIAAGVRVVEATVVGDWPRGAGVRLEGGEHLPADHVLVCAGAWTPTLLPETADLVTPVAQPVLHFLVDEPQQYRAPAFPPFAADIAGSGWYGFPALDDGRLKLGHHGPGEAVHPDRRGGVSEEHVKRARRFLAEALPSLADAPLVGSRVCMYCDSRDGDLLIDDVPGRSGVTVATGGSGHGFKFAPVLGDIIADAVEGRPNPWLHRFRWRWPSAQTGEEARLLDHAGHPGPRGSNR